MTQDLRHGSVYPSTVCQRRLSKSYSWGMAKVSQMTQQLHWKSLAADIMEWLIVNMDKGSTTASVCSHLWNMLEALLWFGGCIFQPWCWWSRRKFWNYECRKVQEDFYPWCKPYGKHLIISSFIFQHGNNLKYTVNSVKTRLDQETNIQIHTLTSLELYCTVFAIYTVFLLHIPVNHCTYFLFSWQQDIWTAAIRSWHSVVIIRQTWSGTILR